MEGFKNLVPPAVNVVRDGKVQELEPLHLVPGDIIEIRYGMKLPADVRILQCSPDMQVRCKEYEMCSDFPTYSIILRLTTLP